MEEDEIFNYLLSKDPSPGTKNRAIRQGNVWIFPGWLEDKKEDCIVKYKRVTSFAKKIGVSVQILYDIVQLGIKNILARPKCPICGKERKFSIFSRGYSATCGDSKCISKNAEQEVRNLWNKEEYRATQINTKKEWMNKPEYTEFFRKRALAQWSNVDYREKQVESHIEYCKNNPDKVLSGQHGVIESPKSLNSSMAFDSGWEKDFIEFCNQNEDIISINRANIAIPYEFEGISRNYFPDFEVILKTGEKLLIEIKCDWLLEKDDKTSYKLEAAKEFVKTSSLYIDFLVFVEKDLYIVGSKPVFKTKELENRIKSYLS